MPAKKTTSANPKKAVAKKAPAKKVAQAKAAPKPKAVAAKKPTQRKATVKKTAASGKLSAAAKLRQLVVASLEDDKAEDLVCFDLAGKSSLTDYIIIASGKSARHLSALAQHLREKFEEIGRKIRIEGQGSEEWVLVDAGDVIVHLFHPEIRGHYQLEQLWSPESLGAGQH